MSTFNYYFYLDSQGYSVNTPDHAGNFTAIIKVGDTINVNTEYTGTESNANEIRYLGSPNSDSVMNDPDPTSGSPSLNTTWSLTATDNTDHYARWYFFTDFGMSNPPYPAQFSLRILILPNNIYFSGVPDRIGPGGTANLTLNMPATLNPYLDGVNPDGFAYDLFNPALNVDFYWKITTDSAGTTSVPTGYFTSKSGILSAPQNRDNFTLETTTSCPIGTYYLQLYHYNTTPQFQASGASTPPTTGGTATLMSTTELLVQDDPYLAIKAVQEQGIGDSFIELFELTLPNSATTFYFHNGLDYETGTAGDNIYFSSKNGSTLNEYLAMPIEITGVSTESSGVQNRPKLQIANIAYLARITDSITAGENSDGVDDELTLRQMLQDEGIIDMDDLLLAKLTYRTTLMKYTSRVGDSPSLPVEYPTSTYYLERLASDNNIFVQFDLISPADLEGLNLPNRVSVGRYCAWEYQGALQGRGGCTYPMSSSSRWFDKDDKLIEVDISQTSIPVYNSSTNYSIGDQVRQVETIESEKYGTQSGHRFYIAVLPNTGYAPDLYPRYWERLDVCGKTLQSCRIRYQGITTDMVTDRATLLGTVPGDEYLNGNVALPFGGFPGARKYK